MGCNFDIFNSVSIFTFFFSQFFLFNLNFVLLLCQFLLLGFKIHFSIFHAFSFPIFCCYSEFRVSAFPVSAFQLLLFLYCFLSFCFSDLAFSDCFWSFCFLNFLFKFSVFQLQLFVNFFAFWFSISINFPVEFQEKCQSRFRRNFLRLQPITFRGFKKWRTS